MKIEKMKTEHSKNCILIFDVFFNLMKLIMVQRFEKLTILIPII